MTDFNLTPEQKAAWVEALRSGRHKQGKGALYTPGLDTHCCLGVLAETLGYKRSNCSGYVFEDETRTMHLPDKLVPMNLQNALVEMNDGGASRARSFAEIADWIENYTPTETCLCYYCAMDWSWIENHTPTETCKCECH